MLGADQAAQHVLAGTMAAAKTYDRWSGGLWLSESGCESLIVATVARRLASANAAGDHGAITLETQLSAIRQDVRRPAPGRIRDALANSKRVDLALWSKVDRPYGIIEIKRAQIAKLWDDDLEELISLVDVYGLRRGGGVRFGILGGWFSRKGTSALKRATDALEDRAHRLASNRANVRVDLSPRWHWDPSNRKAELVCRAATVTVTALTPTS